MFISPFRIRFILMLPCIACLCFWINDAAVHHDFMHAEVVVWNPTSGGGFDAYFNAPYSSTNPFTVHALTERMSHLHERQIDLPGIAYMEERIDPTGPASFASKVIERELIMRYWLLAPLSTLPLLAYVWLTRKRRRTARRIADGLCGQCGYDLRGHQVDDKCPECGTARPLSPPVVS